MSGTRLEQRNPYKGISPRAWVRVQLLALDGSTEVVELLADTGNPFALIIGSIQMARVIRRGVLPVNTNFGRMDGGWVRVMIPDVGFDEEVLGYASDRVVNTAQRESPDFEGLLGLPLLRMLEYGGDASWFWIRPQGGNP